MVESIRQPEAPTTDHTADIVRHCFDLMIVLHHEAATPSELHDIHKLAEQDVSGGESLDQPA